MFQDSFFNHLLSVERDLCSHSFSERLFLHFLYLMMSWFSLDSWRICFTDIEFWVDSFFFLSAIENYCFTSFWPSLFLVKTTLSFGLFSSHCCYSFFVAFKVFFFVFSPQNLLVNWSTGICLSLCFLRFAPFPEYTSSYLLQKFEKFQALFFLNTLSLTSFSSQETLLKYMLELLSHFHVSLRLILFFFQPNFPVFFRISNFIVLSVSS